jgi:hypothetical protein
MRSLIGVLTFVGFALLITAWRWPDDPTFAQEAPADAVGFTLMLTPFIAMWVMPTRWSLLVFPLAAFALWNLSGWIGHTFIPPPPADDRLYMCGLGAFAIIMLAVFGLLTGIAGRALGFTVQGKMPAFSVYFVQLIPMGGLLALMLLLSSGPRP